MPHPHRASHWAHRGLVAGTLSTSWDSTALMKSMHATLAQFGKEPVTDGDLEALSPFELTEETQYALDRTSGLMREVHLTRRLNSGLMRRDDRWTIRLVQPPAPQTAPR